MGKKRSRAHKVSNGSAVGSKKIHLTELQKALLDKGVFDRIRMVPTNRWEQKHPKKDAA